MGRRIRKDAGGRVTWYQFSDTGLVAEHNNGGQLERVYGWRPKGLWGTDPAFLADVMHVGASVTWSMHYYQNDHLGGAANFERKWRVCILERPVRFHGKDCAAVRCHGGQPFSAARPI